MPRRGTSCRSRTCRSGRPKSSRRCGTQHQGEFDYLLGDWEFTNVSKEYGKGRGYWSAVRLAEGADILDEYRVVGDNGETYYVSSTIRAYNAALDRWELISADQGSGLHDFGTARKSGDEMHIEQTFGGDEPAAVAVAHPLLQHQAGFVFLDGRSIGRRRQDLGEGAPDHRSAPHRSRAQAAAARAGEKRPRLQTGGAVSHAVVAVRCQRPVQNGRRVAVAFEPAAQVRLFASQ